MKENNIGDIIITKWTSTKNASDAPDQNRRNTSVLNSQPVLCSCNVTIWRVATTASHIKPRGTDLLRALVQFLDRRNAASRRERPTGHPCFLTISSIVSRFTTGKYSLTCDLVHQCFTSSSLVRFSIL